MAADSLKYDRVAAALHWITALLVITLIAFVLGRDVVGKDFGMRWLEGIPFHKSLGLTVFVVTVLRLLWRLAHKAPPLPASTPAWQRSGAHAMHFVLYAMMLSLPAMGYLLSSAGPYPLEWFGITLPKLAITKAVGDAAHEAHEIGGYLMIALIVLHVGAALWHQFVQRDQLIARMRLG